jgi:hypothetical protein
MKLLKRERNERKMKKKNILRQSKDLLAYYINDVA